MHKKVTRTETNGKIVPTSENTNHFRFNIKTAPVKANAAAIRPSAPKIKNPMASSDAAEKAKPY
jgi:hypothetical protein